MSVGDDPSRAEYGAPSPEGTAGLLGAARRTAREWSPSRAGYGAPSPEGTAGLLGAARRTARV